MKLLPLVLLFTFPCNSMAEWIEYSARANGDVCYYDNERVQINAGQISVWNRVRYKTSVMGAASYQSYLQIDCIEGSETTLQSTFFSDKNWTTPAMATNTKAKPKKSIEPNSATESLAKALCKE